jgi:hypothetical protein
MVVLVRNVNHASRTYGGKDDEAIVESWCPSQEKNGRDSNYTEKDCSDHGDVGEHDNCSRSVVCRQLDKWWLARHVGL